MDGGKNRWRTNRQRIIEVLSNHWELTPNERSSVVDSLTNHIIRKGRRHPGIREWEPIDQNLRIMLSFIGSEEC